MIIGMYGSWQAIDGDPVYRLAYDYGRALALAGHRILTGGYSGVMEAASRGAVESGGEATGVTCPEIDAMLPKNKWVTHEVKANNLRDRLARCLDVEVTVFFPGRKGTISELSFALELRQKNIFRYPVFLTSNYWDKVIQACAAIDSELPYNRSEHASQSLFLHCCSPEELLEHLK